MGCQNFNYNTKWRENCLGKGRVEKNPHNIASADARFCVWAVRGLSLLSDIGKQY